MCLWVGSHAPSCGRQLLGLPSCMEYLSPRGVLLPQIYGTTASPLWLKLRGPAAWQATPSWAFCRLACHQLPPWVRATFAMVPDAVWPGSDQWPWSTPPATGPMGRLGRPSASDPGGVDHCVLSLCCPRCMNVCGVLAHLAPVHRCARCVRFACAVGGCVPPLPPLNFSPFLIFCSVFFLFCFAFFLTMEKGARARCRHRHGQLVQRCCSLVFSCVRRCCFVGSRAPRAAAHASWCTWVRVGLGLVSCLFTFCAGWLGGCVGSGCGLWLRCSLAGLG